MIYLLGGPPRCGKTMVAKQLAAKLDVPWITADMLESVISVYVADKDYPQLFPKNVIREKTDQSNDTMYDRYSTQEIVAAYIQQAQTSWRAIKVIVEHARKFGESVIIDGHQIHPKLINDLMRDDTADDIRAAVLIKSNQAAIIEGAKKNRAKNDWLLQKTKDETTFSKIAEMIKTYGEYLQQEAKNYNIKTFDMDSNFEGKVDEAIVFLSA